jgi:hypothetical protein
MDVTSALLRFSSCTVSPNSNHVALQLQPARTVIHEDDPVIVASAVYG